MKLLTGGLTFVLALCLAGTTQANFVIDDFTPGGTDTGTLVSAVGSGGAFVTPSGSLISAGSNGASGLLTYNISAATPNPTGYGYFSTLAIDLVAVGDWQVEFVIDNDTGTVGGEGSSVAPTFIANGSTTTSVDLIASLGTENLNGLQQLMLRFTALAPDVNGNRVMTLSNIAAVPEPTSFALLGLTCLGGGAVASRRRRRKAIAA